MTATGSRALDRLAGMILEDGRPWAALATPWQLADARHVLDGPERLAYLTRPRGASKTVDLAGVMLAALVEQLPPTSRSYGFAVDRGQAQLLLDAAAGFVSRTPGLDELVKVETWRLTNRLNAATFDVMAADDAGAWGLRPHLVIVDEFAQWPTTEGPRRLWSAIFSAVPKVEGARLVLLTSAGDPAHPAGKLLERARRSPRWYVSEVPGPVPWISPDDLEEQRAELLPSEYARLHLNVWTTAEDRLTTVEDLEHAAVLDGPQAHQPGARYALGLDLSKTNDRTVVAVCRLNQGRTTWVDGVESQGLPVVSVDRLRVWTPSRLHPIDFDEVERAVLALWEGYGRPVVRADPYEGGYLGQRLRSRGVTVEEFTFSQASTGRLGRTLFSLLRDRRLMLDANDAELLDELAHVRLVETGPGHFRLDHDRGRHDDRAIAIALAAEHLLGTPEQRPGWVGRYSGSTVLSRCPRSSRETELLTTMAGHGDPTAKALLERGTPGRRAR